MAALTFNEILLFIDILRPDFDIEKFTPQVFFNMTNFQTSYRYVDVLMFAKYVQNLRRSEKFRTHLGNVMGKKSCGDEGLNEIRQLTSSLQSMRKFLLSGDYNRGFLMPLQVHDDRDTTVSKRFKNMRLAATKTGNLTLEEQKQKNAFYFYSEAKKRLPAILAKSLNQSYIASMYNSKISGDFENERKNAIEQYNQFLRDKKLKVARSLLTYNSFFDVLVINNKTDLEAKSPTWYNLVNERRGTCDFIKSRWCNLQGNRPWKESFVNSSVVSPAHAGKHYVSAFLHDVICGNIDGVEDFAAPIFHNDKFSHFADIPNETAIYKASNDHELQYKKLAEHLNSKGFKVRTRAKLSRRNTLEICYNRRDIILGCWQSSTKNYKIENLKYSVSSLISDMLVSFSDLKAATKTYTGVFNIGRDLSACEGKIIGTYQQKIYSYCNFLKTLYTNETDLEMKTLLEASIFSVREVYKREYAEYAKSVGDFNKTVKSIIKNSRDVTLFHKRHNAILNDDLYPQGILKETGKINEMKLNVTRHIVRCIGVHGTYSYDAKMNAINERLESMKKEYDTLANSWIKANRVKASELGKHIEIFEQATFQTMSEIYINVRTDANGVKTADIRTDEGSLPAAINSLVQKRVNGDESGCAQNAEDLRKMGAGEGIQNDNNVELDEMSREQCRLIHEQRTGKKIDGDKLEFAETSLDRQTVVNPEYTVEDGMRDRELEVARENEHAQYLAAEADRIAAERIAEQDAYYRASEALRRAANRPAFINKIIDFFTK